MNYFSSNDFKRLEMLFFELFSNPIGRIKSAPPHQLAKWSSVLDRQLSRERARGINKHYRYDFNRHVALASIRQRVMQALEEAAH